MVNVLAVPGQLTPLFVKVGVTVMVAVTADDVALVAIKEAIFPLPLAANPIDGVLFIQLYTTVPPVLVVLKFMAVVALLLHKDWFGVAFTVAVELTVIVNELGVPTQLTPAFINVGVTVIVAMTGAVLVLVAVNDGIFPEPLAANPIDGVLFTQLKIILLPAPPLVGLVKLIAAVDTPLHNV